MSRVLVIEAWLHDVVLSPHSAGCISPRRRARSTAPSSPPAKRRRPLQPLAANTAVPMPRPPSPTKPSADTDRTPRAARRSPRKAARNTSRESAPPPLSLDFFDNTAYASALAAPPKHFLHSESLSRESSSVAGSSARSKRSVSPVKGIADLTFENGFRYIPADEADDIELGDDIDALCSRLADIEQGDGVVPDRVRPHIQTLPRRVRERFRERNYAPAAQDARSELYLVREFLDILELHRDSARHNGSAHSEAAWNDAVHSVVLRLALRETDGIIWSNVYCQPPLSINDAG
ncbi:hypothetical protein DIS24_g12365 [Lasiodiplodia hormozganensis]|uniref:PD-(D/E)XK nuclease-like domain-containing protein n=1 Tax=Lasiodiplodia hormozganensis TaxID=869390 RepID=A0AA39TLA7_9PEZI|nr:hypothetical protein DIS24_g12365 [Lasiodiplodia hormozganensis]